MIQSLDNRTTTHVLLNRKIGGSEKKILIYLWVSVSLFCISFSSQNKTPINAEAGAYGIDCLSSNSCLVSGFFDGGTANGGTGNGGSGSSGVRPPVMMSITVSV